MTADFYPTPVRGLTFDGEDTSAPIRILVVADGMGPTQFISFLRPMQAWREAGVAAVRVLPENVMERTRRSEGERGLARRLEEEFADFRPTVVIFSRYSGKDADAVIALARTIGAPVVHHLDDDLFEAPISLGIDIYQRYRQPHRVYTTYRIAEASDLIYVSTPALAERVRSRLGAKRVYTSRLYVGAEPPPPRAGSPRGDDEIRIGYMASGGHAFDFELVAPALFAIVRRFPKARIHLFGTIATTAVGKEFGGLAVVHDRVTKSYNAFRQAMASLDWDIGLAPLRDNPFNACKAPTKWVEYAEAGIATLASDHPVYRPLAVAGAAALSPDSGWEAAIADLIENPAKRQALVAAADETLRREFGWSRVEEQVLDLLAAVCPTDTPTARQFQVA